MAKYDGFDAQSFKDDLKRLGRELDGAPHALDRAMHVLAGEIKHRCPVDTGHLRDSVQVKPVEHQRHGRISQEVEVGDERPPDGRWYVGFVEFGNREVEAQPFIRPAIRAKEAEMLQIIEAAMPKD
jgi:HK97 gp10 family phage protein